MAGEGRLGTQDGRLARVVDFLRGTFAGSHRGGDVEIEEQSSADADLGLTQTPEEMEARRCRERLWKAALLALLEGEDRDKLIDGDSTALLSTETKIGGAGMTVEPVFSTDGHTNRVGLKEIIIYTELSAVGKIGNEVRKVRVALGKDSLDESSLGVVEEPETQPVSLRPVIALTVVSQLAHNFGVNRPDLEALKDPF